MRYFDVSAKENRTAIEEAFQYLTNLSRENYPVQE